MLPNINLLGKEISFYAICALVGILVVLFFELIYTKKKGYDEVFMLFVLLYSAIGIMIGGHLLYAITMHKYIVFFFNNLDSITSFKEVLNNLNTIFGGSVFYGGLLGGMFVATLVLRKQKFDIDPYIGIGVLCIPLFHFFGRMGCFLSGCCYGVESEIGFYFNHSLAPGCQGVSRFPVQLVEALCNLIIFFILFYLFDRKKRNGKFILICYLISYASIRFILEFFRGDEYRGFIGRISTSQFISILIIAFTLFYVIMNCFFRKAKKA